MTRSGRRLRFRLVTAMVVVALAATLFAWAAERRRERVSVLASEYQRQQDRVRWAERMQGRGYVSGPRLAAERKNLDGIRSELSHLGAGPSAP